MQRRARLERLSRNAGNSISSVVCSVHREIDEAVVRVGVCPPDLELPNNCSQTELKAATRSATSVAEISSASTGRNVEWNQLVVNGSGEQRCIVLQATCPNALEPELISSRSLRLEVPVNSGCTTRLVSQLGSGGRLERRRDVCVSAVRIGQQNQQTNHRADRIEQPSP